MTSSNTSTPTFNALETCVDISKIITSSHDAAETLMHTAKMIAERMNVDACTIYVHHPNEEVLTLRAAHGLNPDSVGQVSMAADEGLVGLVFQTLETLQVPEMKIHPNFISIPETEEDAYESFLGVPFVEHRKCYGVLGVHTKVSRDFAQDEEALLVTIASQIVGLITKALLLGKLTETTETIKPTQVTYLQIKGQPVAPGVALQKAVLFEKDPLEAPTKESSRTPAQEWDAFQQALENTITDTLALIDKISEQLSPDEAAIFHAHLMFLEDHSFQGKIKAYIDESETSATWAIYQVIQEYLQAFEAIDDPYLKERGADLKDVGFRLLHQLGYGQLSSFEKEGIIVARQVLPGDVARLDPKKIKGIVSSRGGAVSHAAILARSLMIPAICIDDQNLDKIREGDTLALDGQSGSVIINPGRQVVNEFKRMIIEHHQYLCQLEQFRDRICQTRDGRHIQVLANIGLLNSAAQLSKFGAEGVGLYRTEIYFLSLDQYPTIEEQTAEYKSVLEVIPENQPVVFRTLDIGGDKFAPYMAMAKEENPFLGNRAIRKQLETPELLKDQIKAILLAAAGRKEIYLLFPMVTQIYEIQRVKALYHECRQELEEQGEHTTDVKIGAMFEVPSAILLCEHFAHEIDFFAVGSNDLTQYVLAVDRNNSNISHLYDPLHPAVLRLIRYLVDCAEENDKPVEVCGEMASDPDGCVILVGLGIRKLSMTAGLIPVVKERLSMITEEEAEHLAEQALDAVSAKQVRRMINEFFSKFEKSTS